MRAFFELVRAIAAGDTKKALKLLTPPLAQYAAEEGASRQSAKKYFFADILHYLYEGDTALHMAAAGYRVQIAKKLIQMGAGVNAKNRRGQTPLHYSAAGGPGAPTWDPEAQVAIIELLVSAGTDVDASDRLGVTPLHSAVRNRCAAAVAALLTAGADRRKKTKRGSTPMATASRMTGRGGSGSAEARAQQEEIQRLLRG
jgi:hypothetical protein